MSPSVPSVHKRQSRKRRRIFFVFLFFVFLSAIGYGVLFAPAMRIKSISVLSLPEPYRVSAEAVIRPYLAARYLHVFPGDHGILAALFRIKEARNDFLRMFPEFSEISIRYDAFHRMLVVQGKLRTAVAKVCNQENSCLLVDGSGALFFERTDPSSAQGSLIPIISEQEQSLSPGGTIRESAMRFMVDFFRLSAGTIGIEFFTLKNDYFPVGTIHAVTDKGWTLILDERTRPYVVIQNLNLLLSGELQGKDSRIQYIDARFEDRAYYKLE